MWKNSTISKTIKIVVSTFFGLMFLFHLGDNKSIDDTKSKEAVNDTSEHVKETDTIISLNQKLINSIKDIKTFDNSHRNKLEGKELVFSLELECAVFESYSNLIHEGLTSENKENQKLATELKKQLVALQIKEFPEMRKAYKEAIYNVFWENNVEVDLLDKTKTLQFTGAIFANNKNKKQIQESYSEMLNLLRFKKIIYKWYKGEDEYTVYQMNTLSDSELAK